jgi:CheY-like chemotaxis protein
MRDARSLLLVDDDETTRDLLSLLLGGEGWAVITAESGDAAIRILSVGTPPDVILSDLQMPGLCGTAMATAIRTLPSMRNRATLLIAMTATDKGGPPAGFDDLLVKPFAPRDLLQCCEALWSGDAAAEATTPEEEPSEPSIATATFDRMKLSMPAAQLRALYDFALSDADTRILRMSAARETGDDEAYRREAHALKGSCGMVGAMRLRTLAAQAEENGLQGETVTQLNPLSHFHSEIAQIRHMLESLLSSAS